MMSNYIDRIKFAWYCLKRSNDAAFCKSVRDIERDHSLVSLEHRPGALNSNIVYYIEIEENHSGFYANFNRVLHELYFADYLHLQPVVRYPRSFSYIEDHPVNGTTNPFEYYFEQPCGISIEELDQYSCIVKARVENRSLVLEHCHSEGSYHRNDLLLRELARISARYIHLNAIAKDYVDTGMSSIGIKADEKILAVHVRGTDFKRHYYAHPVLISVEEHIQEAERLVAEHHYDKVFLATDDTDAVTAFEGRFGDRLLYYKDVIRSNGNDSVMNSESTRENHHYLLGLEILRDVQTMAQCQGLVAGLSQVSDAARIQRMSTGIDYEDVSILNKGINL